MDKVQRIEIVNEATGNWWLPWLPFFSSLVVAIIALGGVWWQIKKGDTRAEENRKQAIAREYAAWQRDNLMSLASTALTSARHAIDHAFIFAALPTDSERRAAEKRALVDENYRAFAALSAIGLLPDGPALHAAGRLERALRDLVGAVSDATDGHADEVRAAADRIESPMAELAREVKHAMRKPELSRPE